MASFLEANKIVLHHPAEAAATGTITPASGVDLAGFKECTFGVLVGDIGSGGVPTVTIQQSEDDGDSDAYSDVEGSLVTLADDDDDSVVKVSVKNPQKRYLKCLVGRATANIAVGGIVAVLSGAGKLVVTQEVPNGVTLFEPDEGTP